jgi:hypothetical protein
MEQRIADIDFAALTRGRTFFASPAAWEDEVLYLIGICDLFVRRHRRAQRAIMKPTKEE